MRASPRNVASEKFARVNATTLTPILAKAWLVICSGPQAVNVVSALKRVYLPMGQCIHHTRVTSRVHRRNGWCGRRTSHIQPPFQLAATKHSGTALSGLSQADQ